jgi:hypothetical protein
MKYVIQIEIDPDTGHEAEKNPKALQELIGKWQVHKPIGMYFSLTRRSVTIIVEAPNEDAFFEAMHETWVVMGTYPDVNPVVSVEEFPKILQRAGMGK